ncbi:MAG: hypothetical protein VST69_04145 [Nitrospirota bacterium]|nr:hypothetical protein [Nitrospirota bacterium]
MLSRNKIKNKKIMLGLVLPFAFLLTHCAKDFDAPTIPPAPKVAKDVVSSGLNTPLDVVIVPDSAAGAPGILAHEDLLVANFGNNTIVQIDKSVEPHVIIPFADQTDTADLNQPTGIAFDVLAVRGDIYITNFLDDDGSAVSGGAITVFNKDGSLNRVIDNVLFQGARSIVYDAEHSSAGTATFYVSNLSNNTILKVDSTTTTDTVTTYADMNFFGLSGLNPTQLAISPIAPHNLYAANTGLLQTNAAPVGATITVLPTDSTTIPVPSNEIRLIVAGEVTGPLSLDFDNEGRLYVAGHKSGTLAVIDAQIGFLSKSVETGEDEIQGMSVGEGGIYIATEGGKIIEIDSSLLSGESNDDGGGHHG